MARTESVPKFARWTVTKSRINHASTFALSRGLTPFMNFCLFCGCGQLIQVAQGLVGHMHEQYHTNRLSFVNQPFQRRPLRHSFTTVCIQLFGSLPTKQRVHDVHEEGEQSAVETCRVVVKNFQSIVGNIRGTLIRKLKIMAFKSHWMYFSDISDDLRIILVTNAGDDWSHGLSSGDWRRYHESPSFAVDLVKAGTLGFTVMHDKCMAQWTIITTCLGSTGTEARDYHTSCASHKVHSFVFDNACRALNLHAFMQRNSTTVAVCMFVNTGVVNQTGHEHS